MNQVNPFLGYQKILARTLGHRVKKLIHFLVNFIKISKFCFLFYNRDAHSQQWCTFIGVCIKTWFKNGDKVFVNVCHSKDILPPEDISDEKFGQLMTEEIPTFVIPMALGEEKMAKDKGLFMLKFCNSSTFFNRT